MEFPRLTLFGALVTGWLQEQPTPAPDAVMVKLMPPPSDLETLADILFASLGLSGFLAVTGIVLGIVLGGLMFIFRLRRTSDYDGKFRLPPTL
jgi:ABC-type nitrate/sulfonate/bicarbonate transport system permease component